MRYKILEWNINQATNKSGENEIPGLVQTELIRQNTDIIILTEFCFCKNAKSFLNETFDNRGYGYFPKEPTANTENGQNEVLIAWRKELFELADDENKKPFGAEVTWKNNIPNFLRIILKSRAENNGQLREIVIAGVRITMALNTKSEYQKQADLRRKQMEYVYDKLKDFSTVVVAGDLNNYRRNTMLKNWNINELTCGTKGYRVCTPAGQSIYEAHSKNGNEFAEDHFIVKGCEIENYVYDRSFVKRDKNIYEYGGDFKHGEWSIWKNHPGFPDHAILYGDLKL